ncbi:MULTISPECIES: PTS sugar transporter subunit IIA [Microvirgula]|mgnify:CR=1 FL=1|uniref:PTS fructose transporter subunit IIA n=1 Tax=Microvirgula aerodenitrificans TaxID=57480 RepID=A0A2S0P9V5_9NEIS|nr:MULTISPECIES: PTS fructose transporter subunit IIA [Microvirgula]AVY94151.1 PTS fructose transporter subunit IIA [Microvirgula aerodenitrificans]RAS15591.1 PTS system ascorbate-specific IIA component [Microvirgula sp. AG722]
MVGILIITHGDLGRSLADCARHVLQRDIDNLEYMQVDKNDDPEQMLATARCMIERLDRGEGVLVLTDIFGGTPSNIASRLIVAEQVEAIAGINLPMLVRALCYSSQSLETVISKAVTGGLEGVMYIVAGDGRG